MKKYINTENVAFVFLSLLILLPAIVTFEYLYAYFRYASDMYQDFALSIYYPNSFSAMGIFLLLVMLFSIYKKSKSFNASRILLFFKSNPWLIFGLLLFFWIVLSALFSEEPSQSFIGNWYRNEGVITQLFYVSIIYCSYLVKDCSKRHFLLGLFITIANLAGFFMICAEWGLVWAIESTNMLRCGVFLHFNHMGYYLNLACICSIGLFLYGKSKKEQVYFLLSFLFQFYCLIVNNTMGGILATVLGSLIVYIFYMIVSREHKAKVLFPLIGTLALATCSALGFIPSSSHQTILGNLVSMSSDINTVVSGGNMDSIGTERGLLWRTFLGGIKEHPLLGIGPDQIPALYDTTLKQHDRPANEYIYYAYFMGIPALIFYLCTMICLFARRIRELKTLDSSTLIAAGCLIAYMISAFFGNTMYYTTCYLWLLFGFISSESQCHHSCE